MTDNERRQPLSALRVEQLTKAAIGFNKSIGSAAIEHLEARGLRGAVSAYGLGEVPSDIDEEWKRFAGMLSIPYWNLNRQCVSLRFRSLSEGGAKYLQPSGSDLTIYNLKALESRDRTISITEGEFDAMALEQAGYPAVGMPGASSWRHGYARLFDGFDRVIVWGDPDDAGRRFNEEVMKSMRRATAAYMDVDINDAFVRDDFVSISAAYQRAGGQR